MNFICFNTSNFISQTFSLPSPTISYICKNPLIEKEKTFPFFVLEKLDQTCKYFFDKVKIVPCYSMNDADVECSNVKIWTNYLSLLNISKIVWAYDAKNIHSSVKFCLLGFLNANNERYPGFLSRLISQKIAFCSIFHLTVCDQILGIREFKFLTKSKNLHLVSCRDFFIFSENRTLLPLENILEALPFVNCFYYKISNPGCSNYTNETMEILEKMERKIAFKNFSIFQIPQNLLVPSQFYNFIKKNGLTDTEFYFYLRNNVNKQQVLIQMARYFTAKEMKKIRFQ